MHQHVATIGTLTLVAGIAFVGGRVSTTYQGATAAASEQPAQGIPLSAEHRQLESMLGDWEGTARLNMNGEWTEWEVEIDRDLELDGLFVVEEIEATSDGLKYESLGLIGYDPGTKTYENVWAENMSPAINTSTGTYDSATKVWTMTGEVPDPATGTMVKTVTTIDKSDPDKEVLVSHAIMPDGSKVKNFEATLNRD